MSLILLLYKFPEDDLETCMEYMEDEARTGTIDANSFVQMYPAALYVSLIYVDDTNVETLIWNWNNPLAETLPNQRSNAGVVSPPSPTTSASVPSAGPSSPTQMENSIMLALLARPPSVEQYASPLPDTSKVYGGRKSTPRRTHRRRV